MAKLSHQLPSVAWLLLQGKLAGRPTRDSPSAGAGLRPCTHAPSQLRPAGMGSSTKNLGILFWVLISQGPDEPGHFENL